MYGYPPGGSIIENFNATTASTTCGTVTESATANTKGSWSEMTSSLSNDCNFLFVRAGRNSGYSPTFWAFDIGVGAGGYEEVIIPDVGFCFYGYTEDSHVASFPIYIPEGSRVAVRAQSNATSGGGLQFCMYTSFGGNWFIPGTKAETLNFNSSNSESTNQSNPSSSNTKSSWVSLGTPSFDYRWAHIALGNLNNGYGNPDDLFLFDIAYGTGKDIIVSDMSTRQQSSGDLKSPHNYSIPLYCPEGQELFFRHQTSETDTTDRLLWPVLTGVN